MTGTPVLFYNTFITISKGVSGLLLLKDITKKYVTGDSVVHALRGVSLRFRKNEFVSILGQSGCGKTTLLNIIGGLDKYTTGDLVINGKSTKSYGDREWDVYRNHRIGFIFQSYNLIPHQTVLGNVELALTIAGISKEERVERAKQALDRVGLADQYYKKPNQLSGGQCQRVAIARALVNNPEILLADEPTGALDTVTSVQIMDLIKEISKERLVIMVTHNPELADKYSTRIVRMLDGVLIEDTMPYSDEEEGLEVTKNQEVKETKAENKKKEKAKMSFFTAFKLSAKNLISKKGRTAMVGFAGSIGIIGIALVLAFSAGIKGYVASMQDDMLSGNPITISEQTYDLDALMGMVNSAGKQEIIKQPNRVYIDSLIEYFIETGSATESLLIKNDITKAYVDYVKRMPSEYYAAAIYDYGINVHNNIYTSIRESNKQADSNLSISAIIDIYTDILKNTSFSKYSSFIDMFIPSLKQAPSSGDYINSQYNVHGRIATQKDEIMLVIDKSSTVSDLLLAMTGYYTQDEFVNLVHKADCKCKVEENGGHDATCLYKEENDKQYFTYDDILSEEKSFYWYPNNLIFNKTVSNGKESYTYNPAASDNWKSNEGALKLKVVGILQPKDSVSYGCLKSGIYYTEAFTNHVLNVSMNETGGILDYVKSIDEKSTMSTMTLLSLTSTGLDYTYDYYNEGTVTLKGKLPLSNGGLMSGNVSTNASDMKATAIRAIGGNNVANSISLYPVDFNNKNLVTDYLKAWNESGEILDANGNPIENRQTVKFTDTLSLVINLINTMIDIISYALIAFTSVSLVVSTVMIGIITYVSVVERVKEIGVIRSLGGRKKDVSYLFNAETFIIGLLAGVIGIGATYLICEIVNVILFPLINIRRIAMLPISDAIVLICLSVALTLISGLIPAKSAANKDPVIALRTE